MYTCGIIEDEDLARQLLIKYINRYADLQILWSSETILNPQSVPQVDIVFLDLLDIPSDSIRVSEGINEFAVHFSKVIITTAYPADYVKRIAVHHSCVLTKPYTYVAFEKAVSATLRAS